MKHKFIRSVSILLVILTFLTSFSSCAMPKDDSNSSDSSNLSSDSLQDGSNNTGELPLPDTSNIFPLFVDGNYTVKVVTANQAKDFERAVATKLRNVLKTKTKVAIEESTDYLKNGDSYDADAYEILVGETAHNESTEVYKSSTYDAYGIKVIGRKIIFYFSDTIEGEALVDLFSKAIKSDGKESFWVANTLYVAKSTTVELKNIPKYEGNRYGGSLYIRFPCSN